MLFNSQPTVDWLPYEIILFKHDNYTINFGEAYDIENNTVTVKSVSLRSNDGGKEFNEWVQLYDATILPNVKIEISVPDEDLGEMHLILQIIF